MFEAGFSCELQDKVHKVLGKMSLRTYNNISRGVSEECIKEEYILLVNIPASRNRDSGALETTIPDTETAFDWLDYHS